MATREELELDEDGRRIMRHWRQGELDVAIPLAMEANAKAKAWFGDVHPRYAGGLAALARFYFDAGRLELAEAELLEYADIEFRQFGPISTEYAEALGRLSMVCAAMDGRAGDARNLRAACDKIAAEISFGRSDPAFLGTLQRLHQHLQRARRHAHYSAGLKAEDLHDYPASESHYRRALATIAPELRDTSLEYGTILNTLAGLLSRQGRLVEAETMGEEAYEVLVRTHGSDSLSVARCLCDLAVNRQRMGQADPAMNAFEQALGIIRQHEDLSDDRLDLEEWALTGQAGVLLEFAHLAQGSDAVKRALELYRQADPLVRRHGIQSRGFAMHLANIARLHRAMGALGSTYSLLDASTRIFRALGNEASELYHTNLLNAGQLGLSLGYFAEARDQLEESLAWHRRILGDQHEEVAKCLSALVAVSSFQRRKGDFMALVDALRAADDARMADLLPSLTEPDALREAAQIWWRSEQCLLGALELGLTTEEGLAAIYELLLSRRGVVLDSLIARARGARGITRDPLEISNAPLRIDLAEIWGRLGDGAGLVDYVRTGTVFGPVQRTADVKRPTILDFAELATRTPIMVFNFAGLDLSAVSNNAVRYLAFVLHGGPSKGLELLDLGPAKAIDELIGAYRQALLAEHADLFDQGMLSSARSSEIGRAVRAAVLDMARSRLVGTRSLFIVPDGRIVEVPLEGLPQQYGDYVIDELEVTYLYTARDLLRGSDHPPRTSALIIGNPDYDNKFDSGGALPARRRFERLPGSEEEARSVAALLNVQPLLGSEATKERVQAARGPAVLHLATHGFFLTAGEPKDCQASVFNWVPALSNPLRRAGLAFAGANDTSRPDAGILSAEEVLALDLTGTDLVTLSACRSASGDMQIGEGVLGFARAFAIAGARSFVMSAWETPDKLTRQLMEVFYCQIQQGAAPSPALRTAKLEVRKFLPHPFYWNSFLFQGAPKGH